MIVLQRANLEVLVLQRGDSLDRGLRSRHRGEKRQPHLQRRAPNRKRIGGAAASGVLMTIATRPSCIASTICGLPSSTLLTISHWMPRLSNVTRSAAVAISSKPIATSPRAIGSSTALSSSRTLINTHPRVRQIRRCRQLGLGKRHRERSIDSHHLAGRFHLGAEDRVDAGKSPERKHRLLDRNVRPARVPW